MKFSVYNRCFALVAPKLKCNKNLMCLKINHELITDHGNNEAWIDAPIWAHLLIDGR